MRMCQIATSDAGFAARMAALDGSIRVGEHVFERGGDVALLGVAGVELVESDGASGLVPAITIHFHPNSWELVQSVTREVEAVRERVGLFAAETGVVVPPPVGLTARVRV